MADIECRLAVLERSTNRWRMAAIGSTVMTLCILILGAAPAKKADSEPADEVKAKRLVILDDDGNERIVLEVAEKKFNSEIKADKRKEVFATISVRNSDGKEQASLDATDTGFARFKLFNGEGKRRIEAVTAGEGYAKLLIYDKDGKEETNRFPQ